jgi:hypothetical protein
VLSPVDRMTGRTRSEVRQDSVNMVLGLCHRALLSVRHRA